MLASVGSDRLVNGDHDAQVYGTTTTPGYGVIDCVGLILRHHETETGHGFDEL